MWEMMGEQAAYCTCGTYQACAGISTDYWIDAPVSNYIFLGFIFHQGNILNLDLCFQISFSFHIFLNYMKFYSYSYHVSAEGKRLFTRKRILYWEPRLQELAVTSQMILTLPHLNYHNTLFNNFRILQLYTPRRGSTST